MTPSQRPPAYVQHLLRGPFSGRVDPWAEAGRYFQQLHSGLIQQLQSALQADLVARGYQAGKEASLQIYANRQPDIFITGNKQSAPRQWDYETAAAEVLVEAGTRIAPDAPELEALTIRSLENGELVTVVEIISPRNKTHPLEMQVYQEQRAQVFLQQGVNVVEIDLTRSHRRLLDHPLTLRHPYHIAIFLPDDLPRLLLWAFEQAIKPFALPLRGEVLAVDVQRAYDLAYQQGAIASFVLNETDYDPEALLFPSLLTDEQKAALLEAVQQWKHELQALSAAE
ncbi:MAG: DUF4058 family protein [bacterium]|nr:DUF4058 family protein [bacterium]